jgi:outer membrane receptor protein involved in Fe transport
MSILLMIAAAAAPAAEAAQSAPVPAAGERGVIAYPPAFFADARPTSAYDMVVRVPGFTFDKGTIVRGLTGSSGNVLIDGQPPVSKNDTLDEILKRVPAAAVERIELVRGGAPGIDMEGRTVLANVVLRQAAGFRGAVQGTVNLVGDGRVLWGGRVEGQWRWPNGRSAEWSQIYGHGPQDEWGSGRRILYNLDGTVRRRSQVDATSEGTRNFTIGAFETPAAGGRLRINGAYMLNPAKVRIAEAYEGGGGESERDDIDKLQAELGGRYTRALTDRLSSETVLFQQWNNQKTTVAFVAPGLTRDFRLDRKTSETVGRLQLRFTQSHRLSIESGLEAALNKLDSETDLAVNARPVVVPAGNVQVEEKRAEVFLRGTWQATPALSVDAGVRQEASRISSDGDVVVRKQLGFTKPRAAITWAPDPKSQLRLRVEREVGQLNFDDLVASSNVASTGTVVVGNPDLTPQQAWVFEAAYERRFWGDGAAVLTLRRYEINDVVDRAPVRDTSGRVVGDAPFNIGSGRKDEVQVSLTLPLERFWIPAAQLKGQVTWRDTEVVDPLTGHSREISAARPVEWEAHFTQDLPRWKATWGVDATNGYRERYFRFGEIETRKLAQTVLVFAEVKPRPDFIVRVEAQAATRRDVRRIRELPTTIDVRHLEYDGSLQIRLRKLLG